MDRQEYRVLLVLSVKKGLRALLERWQARRRRLRVVVFVDDLDRCGHERIMGALEAVALFFHDPPGAQGAPVESRRTLSDGVSPFVTILAIDPIPVCDAIAARYERQPLDDAETEYAHAMATKYLDKIVQLPFYLPQASPATVEEYLSSLLPVALEGDREAYREFVARRYQAAPPGRVSASAASAYAVGEPPPAERHPGDQTWEIECVRSWREGFPPNPREAKRIINAYLLLRRLPLPAGIPTYQSVVWLGLAMQWPDVAHEILEWCETSGESEGAPEEDALDWLKRERQATWQDESRLARLLAKPIWESWGEPRTGARPELLRGYVRSMAAVTRLFIPPPSRRGRPPPEQRPT
jgi:hypothetical protein